MSVSLDDLLFLTSTRGAALLERLRIADLRDANVLTLITALRKEYPAEDARAAVELARVRAKAVEKFAADAHKMYFTRNALEQASDPRISRYRATPSGGEQVVDVCCGIGADTLAFAAVGAHVTGIDFDPVRVQIAALNAEALGLNAAFRVEDARAFAPESNVQRLFFDPARRDEDGKRIHHVDAYEPPLSLIRNWKVFRSSAKLSPGVNIDQVRAYGGDLEFISVEGELKEASLGIFNGGVGGDLMLQAVLIIGDKVLKWGHADEPVESFVGEPRGWLIEPDAALIRAGLVANAAHRWHGTQLDESIAYITADEKPESEWARAWHILDWMPFNLKKLRDHLRDHRIGTVTVKKRGTAVTPDTLIPQLKLKGDLSRTLILTRFAGQQIVLIAEDYEA